MCFERRIGLACVLQHARALIDEARQQQKLAYITGVYQRFGRNNEIVFANARHKALRLVELLSQVGCGNVSLQSRTEGAPQANILRFAPCETLQRRVRVSN